jgi:hypothetical protein
LKAVVVVLLVLNVLAAFFFLPAKNGSGITSFSAEAAVSSLALLAEKKVKLNAPIEAEVKPDKIGVANNLVEKTLSEEALIKSRLKESREAKEKESAKKVESPTAFPSSMPRTTTLQCLVVKGIKTIASANRLKKDLISLNAINLVIAASNESSHQYWVYLGPYKTKQEALDVNVILRNKGRVGYFFTNEQVKNSISLGAFSSSANAQRLLASLQTEGYGPKIWRRKLDSLVLTAEVPNNDKAILALITREGYLSAACK